MFIHRLESTSRRTRGLFSRKRYPCMIAEDYAGPFSRRMERALLEADNYMGVRILTPPKFVMEMSDADHL